MRAVRIASVLALVLVWSSVAAAQPGLTLPTTEPQPTPPLTRPKKERSNATMLAIAGTAAPILLFVASSEADDPGPMPLLGVVSLFLTPSAGHWYAGQFFTAGMGMRLLGGSVAAFSLSVLIASEGDADGWENAFYLGTLTLGVGVVWDIATAGTAVDNWNRKHATITPTVMKTGDGYGAGLVARF